MKANPKSSRLSKQAGMLAGQPVCVVLNDGRYYVGWVAGVESGELVLSGKQGDGRMRMSEPLRSRQAKIAGLLPAAAEGAGAAAGGAAAGGLGGFGGFGLSGLTDLFGFMQKAMPVIKMGMSMVKTIMPLLGGLK
ncbi:hypothetical protein [Cohnella nanjingensis]|uniref:Uncharacterized protein n=1 Tax=Cohnella nanjingensis TaxID=1387779 RepID=A0A7X0VF20_9BACL|nr:hypothetical protein [Cohnella nanjingensis]MBB6671351.1 hypothetical protein [Cohnella nanjingensis]